MNPKLNDYFYLVRREGKTLHKINWVQNDAFEWGTVGKTSAGFGYLSELIPNPDKKSKVKWIKREA